MATTDITEKTFESANKKRSAAVAEGIAVGEHILVYDKADGTLGLLADYARERGFATATSAPADTASPRSTT